MFTAYTIIKWFHVLLAIVAVGFNASYGILLARAAKEPEHLPYTLGVVRTLDNRFANPAYGLLLVTGLTMVLISPLKITTLWILLALVLYGIAVIIGIAGFTPLVRRQAAALESQGPDSAEYQQLAKRGRVLGIIVSTVVLGIVFLMVTKPTL